MEKGRGGERKYGEMGGDAPSSCSPSSSGPSHAKSMHACMHASLLWGAPLTCAWDRWEDGVDVDRQVVPPLQVHAHLGDAMELVEE
jgi:hypothetical protein